MSAYYDKSAQVSVNEVSRISAGTVIRGEVTSPNDIRIDGVFDGKIISKAKVVVGEKAVIKGDVICASADLWGRVDGNFYVQDTLTLKAGSEVNGDLHVRRLAIELDAKFNGACRMITEEEFQTLVTEKEVPADEAE